MKIKDVAEGLTALVREGKFMEAVNKYYSDEIISIEPYGEPKKAEGIKAVRGKVNWFNENHEVHAINVSAPIISIHHFALRYTMIVTPKENGERTTMDEIAVYEVNDGKIVREQFFYRPEE